MVRASCTWWRYKDLFVPWHWTVFCITMRLPPRCILMQSGHTVLSTRILP